MELTPVGHFPTNLGNSEYQGAPRQPRGEPTRRLLLPLSCNGSPSAICTDIGCTDGSSLTLDHAWTEGSCSFEVALDGDVVGCTANIPLERSDGCDDERVLDRDLGESVADRNLHLSKRASFRPPNLPSPFISSVDISSSTTRPRTTRSRQTTCTPRPTPRPRC